MHKKIKTALCLLGVLGMLYGQQAEAGNHDGESGKYEWDYSRPDGENGYYLSAPEIRVRSLIPDAVTRYRIERADGTVYEESVSSFQGTCSVPEEAFREGTNHFAIWQEGEVRSEEGAGEEAGTAAPEESMEEHDFSVEYHGPEISGRTEKGAGEWYQDSAIVYVQCQESISKISAIRCYQGEQEIKQIQGREGVFELTGGSDLAKPVTYRVVARDQAGRTAEATGEIYIDAAEPVLAAEGLPLQRVTNQPVTVKLCVREENLLTSCEFQAEQELPDGTVRQIELPPWDMDKRQTEIPVTCSESGIYRMKLRAEDAAGHKAEKETWFVLDQEAPVITRIQDLEGREMQYFLWDEKKNALAEDFTETEVVCCLDGRPYLQKEKVLKEGKHIFRVAARDAAGNRAEKEVSFRIDHTAPVICFDGLDESEIKDGCVSLKIYTESERDRITKILLNGETMESDGTSRSFFYRLEEAGNYKIEVTAVDAAGNTATESRTIQITAGRAVKLKGPLKKAAAGGTVSVDEKKAPTENERIKFLFWMLTGGAVVMLIVMGILAEKEKTS